ncbi:hypothetical protein OESDEN_17901, partial [Oesophagostomum dentatum]
RKRQRTRFSSGDAASVRARRKSSIDGPFAEKKSESKKEEKRGSFTSALRPPRAPDSKLAPLISDVVSAASRECMRRDDFTTPSRRLSLRLHSRDDGEEERKISIKSEPSDLGHHETNGGILIDLPHTNGFTPRSPISPRLHSPRVKKESREDEDWDRPGPSSSYTTPQSVPNGRCNGEFKNRLRRNGETKRENGIHRTPSTTSSKIFSPSSSALSCLSEETEVERHYREIGSRIVKMLVDRGLIPSSTEHVYHEIATHSVEHDLAISQEGKEDEDESELVRC